jgi:S-adenosylmethionine hydrolase
LAETLEGCVAEIGPSGNLISDIKEEQLSAVPRDENTIIRFGDHETFGLHSLDHGEPDATMVAFVGGSGCLEIEIVGINLSEMLGIRVGDRISVHW